MRIAAWLSYNGEPFSGFARQNAQLTVQGSIEEALELLFRRPIETTCAGRTDAGVHALCQVVSFDLLDDEWLRRKPESLLKSLNALTHEAISFRSVRPMPEDFSARFSAVSREYRYYICTDDAAPLLMERFSWHLGKTLDIEAMKEASYFLLGEHDFKSFCMAVSAKGKPTHRYVAEINFRQEQIWDSNFIVMTVIGNAFLHSMVRTMVGTLALVGLGKRPPEWVKEVLQARNRQAAGQNAPAEGLVLWHVSYEEQHYYYDPRPHQLLGELEVENHLSQAIDEAPLDTLEEDAPAKPKKKKSQGESKKKKKASKGSGASGGALWAKWRQDKEKEREFIIPRGPNLDVVETDEPSALAEEKPVVVSQDPILREDPSPLRDSQEPLAPAYASLYAVPDIQPSDVDTGKLPVIEASAPGGSSAPETSNAIEADAEAPNATVLSAANARARRRARTQGGQPTN